MREEQAGDQDVDREVEQRAFRESLAALTARIRAFRAELEGYQREIRRPGRGMETTLLMAAFADVLGGGQRTGSLRRLEAAANSLLGVLSVSAPDGGREGGAAEPAEHTPWR